jgi:hypothetical protein
MTLSKALQLKTASAIWQSAVKSGSRLAELLTKGVPLVVGGQSRRWVKAVFVFSRVVMQMQRQQGQKGVAIFLKASSLILMRRLAGGKLDHTRLAGCAVSVTNQGIPRWIPYELRKSLKQGHRPTIRFVLWLCTLGRVLEYRGKLSLKTVTQPGVALSPTFLREWKDFCKEVFLPYLKEFGIKTSRIVIDRPDPEYWGGNPSLGQGPKILFDLGRKFIVLFSSGPNSKSTKTLGVANSWMDLIALWGDQAQFEIYNTMLGLTGHLPLNDLPFFDSVMSAWSNWRNLCKEARQGTSQSPTEEEWKDPRWPGPFGDLGKLSIVEEPGKLRIIAMVDSWTQWMLYPLHRYFFDKVLPRIPQDGTFAQAKPIEGLLESNRKKGIGQVWSYDLSAATDRLPVVLQELLLSVFTHEGYASCWRQLLTSRSYRVPEIFSKTFGKLGGYVKYAVGQPMGAYSSWAMLAITHHALVQFAAWRAGRRAWFSEYAVLGDDIVIGDKDVAAQYVLLMEELGVGIGFHKSIPSTNNSAEFAKKFYFEGELVSPLSVQGIATGWLGPGFVPEVISACSKYLGFVPTLYQIGKYLNIGYRASSAAAMRPIWKLPKLLRSAVLLLTRPGAPLGVVSLRQWYTQISVMGSAVAKVKDQQGLAEAVWVHVVDNLLEPRIRRLREVAKGFAPPEQPLGESETSEWRQWFKDVIKRPLVRNVRLVLDESGELLRKSKKLLDRMEGFKSLTSLELAEQVLARFPKELLVHRPKLPDVDPVVASVLAPRSVARWNKSGQFIGRKGKAWKKRIQFSKPVDLSGRLIRERGRSPAFLKDDLPQ